jgi:periplasmic divalent cation tolerance protein
MREPIVVLVTVPNSDVGVALAEALVNDELAACVNLVGEVQSIYRWQGKVEREREQLCLIKTTRDAFAALRARILALHPYAVPEVIALAISDGHAAYVEWILASVTARGE